MMMNEMLHSMVVYENDLYRIKIIIDNSYSICNRRLFSDEDDDDDFR
jgi:hypothetical protein